MIPIALQIRNFMCYRDQVDIDFRGIHVACLSGDNGAGKSALLDCITWALWGKARVNSDGELMALGATDMEVIFTFLIDDQEFRVGRRRRAGRGSQMIDFHAHNATSDEWQALTGTSVRQTQHAIERLLHIDYDTFINSAFILQGRADEFTKKEPSKRKQVLSDILSLSDYDRYADVARQEARQCALDLKSIDDEITRLEQELAKRPEFEKIVASLSGHLIDASARAEEIRAKLQAARQELQAHEMTARLRDTVSTSVKDISTRLRLAEEERSDLERRIGTSQAVLARRDEILAAVAEQSTLRAQNDALGKALSQRQVAFERRVRADESLRSRTQRLESERLALQRQIAQGEKTIALKDDVVRRLTQAEATIAAMDGLDTRIEELAHAGSALTERRGTLEAENRRLRDDMNEIKSRMAQIQDTSALCPVCRRELAPEDRARLNDEYTQEGKALGDRHRGNKDELAGIANQVQATEQERAKLLSSRKTLEEARRNRAKFQERLDQILATERDQAKLEENIATITNELAGGEEITQLRALLAEIDNEMATIAYDQGEHERVQERLRELGDVDHDRRQLDIAAGYLERDEARLAEVDRQRGELARQLEQQNQELDALTKQLAGIDDLRARSEALGDETARREQERNRLQEEFGAARQRLEQCVALEEVRQERLEKRASLASDRFVCEELTLAFGKSGIQAMIIENILPELQDEANAILDKMPGNSMRVEFQTQRSKRSGEGTIETLDIIISDEMGSRPYALYSGGESFRINFAIRVALSTLLARRSGTRLRTLVIDEGFGTQDSRGRDGLIEAIHAIESDFATILVITHIAEIKDQFPNRLDVIKTPTGSTVMVH